MQNKRSKKREMMTPSELEDFKNMEAARINALRKKKKGFIIKTERE